MRLKKVLTFMMVATMAFSVMACGDAKDKDGLINKTGNENTVQNEKGEAGSFTFFYTEDIDEMTFDDMLYQLERRIDSLGHKDMVTLIGDWEKKQIVAEYTEDANPELFVSAFCKNDFTIKTIDGNKIIDDTDVENVELYYMKGTEGETSTGFLHFTFDEEGKRKMEEATKNASEGLSIVFMLNGVDVNQTVVAEQISDEMYASGFGNLLELFQVCITEGALPVDLYSTSALYDGHESVVVGADKEKDGEGEVDITDIEPDGYFSTEEDMTE